MTLMPSELQYLESLACDLSRLPTSELNNGGYIPKLEAVLRGRAEGLTAPQALKRFSNDHSVLRRWLKETGRNDAAALVIACHLQRPAALVRRLFSSPPVSTTELLMQVPEGWTQQEVGQGLKLFKGPVFCSIIALDRDGFNLMREKNEQREQHQNRSDSLWATMGIWSRSEVSFGESRGWKYFYTQNGQVNWKAIEYMLEVPGGFISARMGHRHGGDFDEAEVEKQLHSLRVNVQ